MTAIARMFNRVGLATGFGYLFLSLGQILEHGAPWVPLLWALLPLALAQIAMARPGRRVWSGTALVTNVLLALSCMALLLGHYAWRFAIMEPVMVVVGVALAGSLLNLVAMARCPRRQTAPLSPGA